MKKILCALLALTLILSGIAMAEDGIVICLDCSVNGQTSVSFNGTATMTAIASVPEGQTLTGWALNGSTVEGENNMWLVFEASGNTVVQALLSSGEAEPENPTNPVLPAEPDEPDEPEEEDVITVKAVGAHLQKLNAAEMAEGESMTEMTFEGKAAFRVTSDDPHQSKIDYWVINGVRYDFINTVKFLTVTDLSYDMLIECVYKKGTSRTLNSAAGEADKLVVSCENAKMAHVKGTSGTAGGYFTEFDFTNEYKNAASGKTVPGGKITVKVTSTGSSRVMGWEFNKAKLRFSSEIRAFFVRDLNACMHYKPIYGEAIVYTSSDTEVYYNVSCTNCSFSGGGHSGAANGKVKAGTVITVTTPHLSTWDVNGARRGRTVTFEGESFFSPTEATSITITVNRDTTVRANMVVN